MPMRSISKGSLTLTFSPSPVILLLSQTLPLNRVVATEGISVRLRKAAGRSLSALKAGVTIRNGAKKRRSFILATSSRFRRKSSTGMVPVKTAGLLISLSLSRERTAPMSGSNRSRTKNITSLSKKTADEKRRLP